MAITTNTRGDGQRFSTSAKRAIAAVVIAATATGAAIVTFQSDGNAYNPLDLSGGTMANGAAYNKYATDTRAQITASGSGAYNGWHNTDFTQPAFGNVPDNGAGPGGQGQFRILCTPSHFAMDDPIIHPDAPGRAHLHMFWGNTEASANTTFAEIGTGSTHDLLNNGGSTCQAGALNRSAYWIPAMISGGEGPNRKIVYPDAITLYYKSRFPYAVQPLPPGIQLLVGNVNDDGTVNQSFPASQFLHWGCYDPGQGQTINNLPSIPGATNGSPACAANQDIQATIEFPQCIATDDGTPTGNPVLTPAAANSFTSHTAILPDYSQTCFQRFGSAFPYQVPQISYLIRWPNDPDRVNWRLSSDAGWQNPTVANPGGSLHGDWLGGWDDDAIQSWIDGCFDPDTNGTPFTNPGVNNFAGPRNCSLGQTGQNAHFFGTGEARNFVRNTPSLLFEGTNIVDDPCDTCTPIPS